MTYQKTYTKQEAAIALIKIDSRIALHRGELKRPGKNKLHIENIINDFTNMRNHVKENIVLEAV